MENFLTWDVLLSFSGCVAGTVIFTEWLKNIFPKISSQIVSFVIAFLIIITGHIVLSTFSIGDIPLYLVNTAMVSLASNGGFDIIKKAFAKHGTDIQDELVLSNEETYLNLQKDPADFKDGEIITFRVKKVDSQE